MLVFAKGGFLIGTYGTEEFVTPWMQAFRFGGDFTPTAARKYGIICGNGGRVTMKAILFAFFAVAFAVPVSLAGNTCTWTGGANDGKWSSAANWDTPPENIEFLGPYAKFAELRQTDTSIEVTLNRGTLLLFK